MKKRNKILLICVCAVMIAAMSVLSTLAYLKDEASVKNTMTVGQVYISMDESPVDLYGNKVNGDRVTENTYKLIPGQKYVKDPIVTVKADSEDCYVYVKLVNEISAIEDVPTVASQILEQGWTELDGIEGVYHKKVSKSETDTELKVFESFTIDGGVDNETLAQYEDAKVSVTAYAVQAAGFADAKSAWTAAKFS